MMDPEFKLVGGILCLVGSTSSLTPKAGSVSTERGELQRNAQVLLNNLCLVYSLPFASFHSCPHASYWAFKLASDKLTKLNTIRFVARLRNKDNDRLLLQKTESSSVCLEVSYCNYSPAISTIPHLLSSPSHSLMHDSVN